MNDPYLYFVRASYMPLFKFGITTDVDRRIVQIKSFIRQQWGDLGNIELLACCECDNTHHARNAEFILRHSFERGRLRPLHDYFMLDAQDVRFAHTLFTNVSDSLILKTMWNNGIPNWRGLLNLKKAMRGDDE